MAGPLDALNFTFDHIGKPLLLNLLDNGDPREFSPGRAFFIDVLGGDVQMEIVKLQIADLENDVHDLQIRVDALDTKVEWYHRIDKLAAPMAAIADRFADMTDFIDDRIAQNQTDEQIQQALATVFTGPNGQYDLSDFDLHLKFMHRVILDLDEAFEPNSLQTIFHAWENQMAIEEPDLVHRANPRDYFNARLGLYQHFARSQRKCASLAALHARATNNPRKVAELDALLPDFLGQQFTAMSENLSPYAKIAAVSDRSVNALKPVVSGLQIYSDADGLAQGRSRERQKLKPMQIANPFRTGDDSGLSLFSNVDFYFNEIGEDEQGLVFELLFLADFAGERGVYQTMLLPGTRVFKHRLANNQPVNEEVTALGVGRLIDGTMPRIEDVPPLTQIFIRQQHALQALTPPKGQTVHVSLGMVLPTLNEDVAAGVAGRGSDHVTHDNALQMRIAKSSPFGTPGHYFVRRLISSSKRDRLWALSADADTPLWQAGKGDDTPSIIARPPELDPTPVAPGGCYVLDWGRSRSSTATSRGVWQSDRRVRYRIVAENMVARSELAAFVAPRRGVQATEGFFNPPAGGAVPLIAVQLVSPLTQHLRLLRQFEGDDGFTEAAGFDVIEDFGPNGETVLADMGGWVD